MIGKLIFTLLSLILLCSLYIWALGSGRLGPYGLFGNQLANKDHWLAIVGDSGVTGAASSSALEAKAETLLSLFLHTVNGTPHAAQLPLLQDFPTPQRFGIEQIEPLTRVPYSRKEYDLANGRLGILLLNLGARLSQKLDVHENSFGYMIGRALSIQSRDIVLVGQDGVGIQSIPAQFARIYEMQTQTLPPLILVSFTANDFCDASVFKNSLQKTTLEFKTSLARAWQETEPYLKAHPLGTRIVVLAPLDVVQVVTNPQVLAQRVEVEGQGQITCGQLRNGNNKLTIASWLVLRTLNLMCPSVTQALNQNQEHLRFLRQIQMEFSAIWKKQVEFLNAQHSPPALQWEYLEDIRSLVYSDGDVSNDCFHPSARGHAKLADFILKNSTLLTDQK